MKGCIDCKFYDSSLDYVTDGLNPSLRVNRKCHLGNATIMNDWWNANGNKVRNKDQFTELPCHEDPDVVKILNGLNDKFDKLLEILNNK